MKKLLLISILILSVQFLSAQVWLKDLKVNKESQEPNFFEFQKAFNSYWKDYNVKGGKYLKNNKRVKAPGWKQFKRWEWYWESRINKKTGKFPQTTSTVEFEKYKESHIQLKTTSGNWTSFGPFNTTGGYDGVGRINCISFHPTDVNTFWVGSPSGGLWKTIDGGLNWIVLTDDNPVMGVSDIAVPSDYETSKTIYIATGDRDGGSSWTLGGGNNSDNNSVGILKSINGGLTWESAGLNKEVSANTKSGFLRIHPTNNSILYAGIGGSIYKTTDNASHWTEIYNNTDYVIDFEFNPENPSIMYACTKNSWDGNVKIIKSIDDGSNWSVEHEFESSDGRIELAVTKANPAYVYALVAKTWGGLTGIFKSTDNGDNFVQVFDGTLTGNSLLGWYGNGSGDNEGQGNYDLTLVVSPTDENLLYLGGVNTWRSRDGGTSWGIVSVWTSYSEYNTNNSAEVHADKHCLKYNGSVLYEGNDGGIYKSFDGTNWTDLSSGLTISQMYRIGVSASSENKVISGLQDNGSKLAQNGNWYDIKGGDGMECLIDYTNSNIQYASYINGQISRTINNWGSAIDINENIGDGTLEGSWVTPYIINPVNPNTIYVGYESVWRSTDLGITFTKYSTVSTGESIRSMAIAPSDTLVMYIADQTNIWRTIDGGANWNVVTGALPTESNSITYIAVHNSDPNLVWVTIGGYSNKHVFESIDGGKSWTDISSGLPNLPTFSIVQNKLVTSSNHLYVGTDIGVFMKDGENDWIQFSSGLPNVMVTELDIYYNDTLPENSKLYAATYGRGLWKSDLVPGPDISMDANLYRIVNPVQKNYCGESIVVPSILIKNNGNDTIHNFNVSYQINDEDIVSFSWTGSLKSGSIETILFDTIMLTQGDYTFKASITDVNGGDDEVTSNNNKSIDFSIVDQNLLFPLNVGFNSQYLPGCWTSEIVNNEGTIGSPELTFVTEGTEPSILPWEGTHMLKFNSKDSDIGDKLRLKSPLLSGLTDETIIISFMWNEDSSNKRGRDSITIQWSLNGIEWNTIGSAARYNINNPGWVLKSFILQLDSIQSNPFYLGFLFTSSNGNNCYLDNLELFSDQALFSVDTLSSGLFYVSETKNAAINLSYTTNVEFTENTFSAYLSDSLGHFDDEILIGSLISNSSGTIMAAIPENTPSGNLYKVRVKSSNPIYISPESNPFKIIFDSIKPELIISSLVGSQTSISPIIVKFSFTEEVVGFELSDIIVNNGTASNLNILNNHEYQAEITPVSAGIVYVNVHENVVRDFADNYNLAATQWSTEYSFGVGIEELNQLGISIYPNPSKGEFTLKLNRSYQKAIIKIIDLTGAIISSVELKNSKSHNFNIASQPKGIYIIQIRIDNKVSKTQLILN